MEAKSTPAAAIFLLSVSVFLLVACSSPLASLNSGGVTADQYLYNPPPVTQIRRSSFPSDFFFGASSSAFQYEGSVRKDGREPSIIDFFTHDHPEKINDGSNGDVADDFYDRYKEDIKLMKRMGINVFRFSISWSRILPNGKLSGGVNRKGIDHYNKLIDELVANGIEPFVTLFHLDLPLVLEDEYGGFLSEHIVKDFQDFAETCFREFGDRVKHWMTLNEPYYFSTLLGYPSGSNTSSTLPQCFLWTGKRCYIADIGRSPYILTHNQLLAHAAAADLYKKKYQVKQKGKIGIVLNVSWYLPYNNSKASKDAVARTLDFSLGWFMNPLTRGKYPSSMMRTVGDRLPSFSKKQAKMINGSFDFIGINYYTSYFAYRTPPPSKNDRPSFFTDQETDTTPAMENGTLIGPLSKRSAWIYVYAPGLRDMLKYIKRKYKNPTIYVTENGVDDFKNKTPSVKAALKDLDRVSYHQQHLFYLHKAISEECVDVRGYFVWTFMDDFEFSSGYTRRYGLFYVDYDHGLKRKPKESAKWYRNFLEN